MSTVQRSLSPEDVLSFQHVEDAQISRDGAVVAFVVGDSFKTDTKWPKSTIWLVAAGAESRPPTCGPRTGSAPRWPPHGRSLSFLSDRLQEGQRQVFVLSRDGGEARALPTSPARSPCRAV